jgi:hypothetical protein
MDGPRASKISGSVLIAATLGFGILEGQAKLSSQPQRAGFFLPEAHHLRGFFQWGMLYRFQFAIALCRSHGALDFLGALLQICRSHGA